MTQSQPISNPTIAATLRAMLADAGWVLVAALVLEVVLRVVAPQPLHRLTDDVYEPSDKGRRYRPGAQSICNNGFGDHPFHINQWRARDKDYGPKQPGELRVLVVGDSFSENRALPVDAIYPNVLERQLSADNPGARISVVNAGMAGWGLWHMKRYIDEMLPVIDPDVVVVSLHVPGESVYRVRETRPIPTDLVLGLPVRRNRSPLDMVRWAVWFGNEWLESRSHVWVAMRRLTRVPSVWTATGTYPRIHTMLFDQPLADRVQDPTAELLDLIKQGVEQHGARFAMLSVPRAYEASPPLTHFHVQIENADVSKLDLDRSVRLFADIARQIDVPGCDPTHALRQSSEQTYFIGFEHWNELGNEIVATELRACLERVGYLNVPPVAVVQGR